MKSINKGTILIIESSFPSGSNTRPLVQPLQQDYVVDVYPSEEIYFDRHTIIDYIKYISALLNMSSYELIISSHGVKKLNPKQTLIQLWHGIPLKSMMYMENDSRIYDADGFNIDYLITSSKLESTLLAACMHIPFANHQILGSPRTDYLFQQKDNDITDQFHDFDKVLLYVPTYRSGYQNRVEGEDALDLILNEQFIQFLEENSYLLIVKLHPLAEKEIQTIHTRHIMFLTNEKLQESDLDFYQVLPHTNLLITDYSSIYFDYLLTNNPIVFINQDLEHYSKVRGFLLEPYEDWTPGDHVASTEEVIQAIQQAFDQDDYTSERERLKEMFIYHQDGRSVQRVVNLVEEIMKK
ncbi:CDP-glycerol glycerophosphotransferase (TagB/SpsB family) [Alkalibacillus salilacus]|uniref:CDP-glycerol glycerophosphotransferase (TagB/SpsB family) n=2 Tax=Alkalibacillus salilacus TaxID=284582 RepID=A0ABT9VHT9_9BACI|nr:CDP-glycerol glycerophosphotransferase (TagB/SpsB family) [Alkalibacillus salilacus]